MEAGITDLPGYQFVAFFQRCRNARADRQPFAVPGHDGRSRPVAELRAGQKRLDIDHFLMVEGRKLDGQHQHAGIGFGAHDVPRGAQGGHGGITAHEADQHALHLIGQAEVTRDDLVDAGRDEAGAACHDEMRDLAQWPQLADGLQ